MLRKVKGWLARQLEQFRLDAAQFSSDEPIPCGTGRVSEIVPPIAGARLRSTVSTPSMVGYLFIADAWHSLLCRLLQEDTTFLDIGCGCGKMARNLLFHPHVKSYIGFDSNRDGIDFCQQHIASRSDGRFVFHYLDVHSDVYNPHGTLRSNEVAFPAADRSVDFALAASLFTHLLERDARHYLQEASRVLSPNGALLASLHSEPPEESVYSGDEIRIDVSLDYFIGMARDAGLHLKERLGTLCGQDALLFCLS
jgi:SAM-dependent methyltransferase